MGAESARFAALFATRNSGFETFKLGFAGCSNPVGVTNAIPDASSVRIGEQFAEPVGEDRWQAVAPGFVNQFGLHQILNMNLVFPPE